MIVTKLDDAPNIFRQGNFPHLVCFQFDTSTTFFYERPQKRRTWSRDRVLMRTVEACFTSDVLSLAQSKNEKPGRLREFMKSFFELSSDG